MKKLAKQMFQFFTSYRKTGTSSLINKIALENDVWVLVPEMEDANSTFPELKDKAKIITLVEISEGRLDGLPQKPILVDNHTMIKIAQIALMNIENMERNIDTRNRFILNIENNIRDFKLRNNVSPNPEFNPLIR